MKKLRIVISWLLTVALLLSMCVTVAFAADSATLVTTIPEDGKLSQGGTFTLSVTVPIVADAFDNATVDLKFDNTILKVTALNMPTTIGGKDTTTTEVDEANDAGAFGVTWAGSLGITMAEPLVIKATFKVLETASVGLKFDLITIETYEFELDGTGLNLPNFNTRSVSLTITTTHVHQWSTNWTSDGTHHWHECTAEGCTLTAGTANSGKGGYAEHDWTAANCTTAKTCSICGKTEGSALGHDWADATCTAPKTCKRTGCTATDGSPLGHDWDTVWTIGDDQHWHKCNRTGCTAIKDAANHIPDRNAATEDDPVKCTECGKVLTPALGHVHTSHLTSVAAQAPTCTAPGNAAYWKCSCDKLFSDDTATTETTLAAVTKAALGHDHNGPWVTTDENEHWKVCAREGCNEQLDKAVHTPSAWVNVGDGYHHQTCTVCERELTHEVCTFGQPLKYNATSHWEECTKCGNKQNEAAHEFLPDSDKCTGCDYTKSSTITIITPTQPGDSKPAEGNPSTGAVSGPVGYIAIGLAVVGALCLGAKKLTQKHED